METTQTLKTHAIVEIMGQKKLAGYATTEVFGSTAMLRVDIPATANRTAFTQYFGMGSIYCITPVDEQTAQKEAEALRILPPVTWEVKNFIQQSVDNARKLLGAGEEREDD